MNPMTVSRLFYRGSSMKGTFIPGDRIILKAIPFAGIGRGDVIVFKSLDKDVDDCIAHRVVGIHASVLITRGDYNPADDVDPVTEEMFIGRVDCFERKGGIHKVRNGEKGLRHAERVRAMRIIARAVKRVLRRPYRMLRCSGIMGTLWRPEIERIDFQTPEGQLAKYVHHGRIVATCWLGTNKWSFKRPYDLIIRAGSIEFEKSLFNQGIQGEIE